MEGTPIEALNFWLLEESMQFGASSAAPLRAIVAAAPVLKGLLLM